MIPLWVGNLAVLALLLPLSAFCAAAEIGLLSVGRLRARQLADEGKPAGRRLLRLLERPGRMVATILVSITTLLYTMEALVTKTSLDVGLGMWIPVLVTPLLLIIFAEVTPILYASQNPEPVALAATRLVSVLEVLLFPVVTLFTGIVTALLWPFGLRPLVEHGVTEDEIRMAIEVAEEEGLLEEDEGELLTGVMEFHEKRVREVMIPRVDMVCVAAETPVSEVLSTAVEAHHSRLPVYAETVDNIVGMVYLKDLIPYLGQESAARVIAAEAAREPYFVPETRRVDAVLRELQRARRTAAVVYGEHGGTSGLVTVEDLLEEIVGEIADEHDVEETELEQLAENLWRLDPRLTLRQIERLTEVALLEEFPETDDSPVADLSEADTLRELILTLSDKTPETGDRYQVGSVELLIEETDGLRIERVRMRRQPADRPSDAAPDKGG